MNDDAIRRAIDFMWDHHAESDMRLEKVCAELRYSRFYFTHRFKDRTGVPPIRYLSRIRIYEAQRLLQQFPHLSIHDVCFRVGLNSPGTFSTTFSSRVGLSPGRFRQLCRLGQLPLLSHDRTQLSPPRYTVRPLPMKAGFEIVASA